MYREAAEAYKEGPQDSAVLLNKTAIAYHQMLRVSEWRNDITGWRIKANPHYAEAINNLGTVFYARKSFRRAIGEYKKALRINPHRLRFGAIWASGTLRARTINEPPMRGSRL